MTNYLVSFEAPRMVGVAEGVVPTPSEGELLVETTASLISTGTELTASRPRTHPVPCGLRCESSQARRATAMRGVLSVQARVPIADGSASGWPVTPGMRVRLHFDHSGAAHTR